ncbi:MAG: glutathione S-transferase family protein [Pseudomonadota bacterium]
MILYMVPVAPNPTKVMLYLAEKSTAGAPIEIDTELVNTLKGEQNSPAHLQRNPFGAVPVLEIAQGDYIFESLPIIDYLETLNPVPSMWGGSAREIARARELERIADLRILDPLARYIHATNSPIGLPAIPAVAEQAEGRLPVGFGYLNDVLSDGRPYLLGEEVSVADCTLQAAFQFMRFAKFDFVSEHEHVAAWDARYRERPAAKSVLKF